MKLEDIYTYYQTPHPTFLNKELTVCYILSVLLEKHSYGTELIEELEQNHPNYRLSDTVLYTALTFLEEQQFITGYWQKVVGRGRPRRMFQLTEEVRPKASELAQLWHTYMKRSSVPLLSS